MFVVLRERGQKCIGGGLRNRGGAAGTYSYIGVWGLELGVGHSRCRVRTAHLQRYLAHYNQPPPRTLQQGYA